MTHMEGFLPRPINEKVMPFLKENAYGREVVEASMLFARQYYLDSVSLQTDLLLEQSKNGEKKNETQES